MRRGADLRVGAPGRANERALPGAPDHAGGGPIATIGATERSGDLVAPPGRAGPALDGGPIQAGEAGRRALAVRPRFSVERPPRHAPKPNGIERVRRDPERPYLAHRPFRGANDSGAAIRDAVAARNHERRAPACAVIPNAA